MAIDLPESQKEVEQRAKTDVQRNLPGSNPFLKNSYLGALITGFSLRVFDFYTQLDELTKQMFVQTATDEFLVMFGAWFDITRNPATQATGNVIATGLPGAIILAGTNLQASDARQYTITDTVVIVSNNISITTLARVGSTVTATAAGEHNLSSLVEVTISGAVETAYNGTFSIVVISETEFTYGIAEEPTTPATGTILADYDSIPMPAISLSFGSLENQVANTALTFTTPIAGVDGTAAVDFDGLVGAVDEENDEDFRARIIDRVQNPVANFNTAAIVAQAKTVPGVTRVFVFEATNGSGVPEAGVVTIYFVTDGADNIFPTGSILTDVRDAILAIKPAHTFDDDVITGAPTELSTDFTISGLDPSSATMQTAVITSLEELFADSSVGVDVTENSYNAAISQTIDRETGDTVVDFTVTAPAGDIVAAFSELPTLGTVTFVA